MPSTIVLKDGNFKIGNFMNRKFQKRSLRKNNFVNLGLVLAALLSVTACIFQAEKDPKKVSNEPVLSPTTTGNENSANNQDLRTSEQNKNKKEDKGDFIVEHLKVENPRFNDIDQQIKDEKLLEKAADKLNRALILPNNIALRSKDCNEVNAFFDSKEQSITICYELMDHYYKLYRSAGMENQKAYDKMFDAVNFVFLHEVGHALIYNYKLPIMGNEEDAADRCSAYINIEEIGEDGVRAVLAAADAFNIESKQNSPTSRNMADEHLLQEQRFYNSLCMIYGSNSSKYDYFVTKGYLPKERAVRCPTEYQKTVDSWINLLAPWRKDK